MKTRKLYLRSFAVLLLLLFTTAGFSFELLQTSVGAEGTSLGGAMSATVNDPSALFWNPAGLANINGKEKQKNNPNLVNEADQKFSDDTFDKLFENNGGMNKGDEGAAMDKARKPFELQFYTSYGYLTMSRHLFMAAAGFTFLKGAFGVGLLGDYAPGIEGYDSSGNYTGTVSYGSFAGYLGYAWEVGMIKMGLALGGYDEAVAGQNYFGGGLNLGVQMTPIPILHIGATIQNLPGIMQTSVSNASSLSKLNTIVRLTLGISTPPPDANVMLLLGLESNLDEIMQPVVYANVGLQIKFAKYFYLRGGLRDGNLAFGLAMKLPFISISLAANQDRLRTGFQEFIDITLDF